MHVPSVLLRLPAHLINGITVATGIALVQALGGGLGGLTAALTASSGAVFASLADVPNAPSRTGRRVLTGALVGCITSLVVALLAAHPFALGIATMLIAFASSLMLAWGLRAAAISFVPMLALVFTMAAPPPQGAQALLTHAGWTLLGAALYLGWACLVSRLLQPRYRSLALARALEAAADLLRSRAARLSVDPRDAQDELPLQAWIERQATLDERLQAARDLLFAAPDAPGVPMRIALLLLAIDLRDTLFASELDLELLGHDAAGERVRGTLGHTLHRHADAIDRIAEAMRSGQADAPPPAMEATRQGMDTALQALAALHAEAAQNERVLIARSLIRRAEQMTGDVAAMQGLLRGGEVQVPLAERELQLFVSPEGWPLATLRAQWRWSSPVMRHALRSALALGSAYFIARALPWASHPHWLVLSVAVVLRGNLFQTLARRDARVAGTLVGCLLVLGLAQLQAAWLSTVVFVLAVGVAHSFVTARYLVTAAAATVMALLQAHLVHPQGGFGVGERLADTLLGALLAWGFSYVLPWWERRSVTALVERVQRGLANLAGEALRWPEGAAADLRLRLARREAYDAIGGIAAAAQRSAAEPRRVQLPLYGLATLLSQSHVLLAQLASARSLLLRRAAELDRPAAEAALQSAAAELQRVLAPQAAAPSPASPAPDEPLPGDAMARIPSSDAALLPWLQRRLQMAARAARRTADAARVVKASVPERRA